MYHDPNAELAQVMSSIDWVGCSVTMASQWLHCGFVAALLWCYCACLCRPCILPEALKDFRIHVPLSGGSIVPSLVEACVCVGVCRPSMFFVGLPEAVGGLGVHAPLE